MTNEAETYVRDVAGRDILFRHIGIGQLLVAQRRAIRLKSQADAEADDTKRGEIMSKVMVAALDLVESLIVNPEDVEYLEEQMFQGKIDYEELMEVLKPEEEKTRKAAKKVGAKAAKTVASRGRTKR